MIEIDNPTSMMVTASSLLLPTPPKFKPGPFDVICARGKQAYNHTGNKYFRGIISNATEKYSKVESKLQRSMIVTDIVTAIREKGNGFLRLNDSTDEWVECSDVVCREKVGQYFRKSALAGCRRYKSKSRSIKQSKKVSTLPSVIAVRQQQRPQQSLLLSFTKKEEEDVFPPQSISTSTSTSTNYDTTTTSSYGTDISTSNNECKYRTSSPIPTILTNLVLPDDDTDNDDNQEDDDDDATTESNGSDNSLLYTCNSHKVFNRTFFDIDENYEDDLQHPALLCQQFPKVQQQTQQTLQTGLATAPNLITPSSSLSSSLSLLRTKRSSLLCSSSSHNNINNNNAHNAAFHLNPSASVPVALLSCNNYNINNDSIGNDNQNDVFHLTPSAASVPSSLLSHNKSNNNSNSNNGNNHNAVFTNVLEQQRETIARNQQFMDALNNKLGQVVANY